MSEILSIDFTVSTTSVASEIGRDDRGGGSSSERRRSSSSSSWTGAQRLRRDVTTSRKCMIAESNGEDVGGNGEESVVITGF